MSDNQAAPAPVSASDADTAPDSASVMRARVVRFAVFATIVGAVIVAYSVGLFDVIVDTERFADAIERAGTWSYVVFVIAFITLEPFGIPGTPFVVASSLLWPPAIAIALCMIGGAGASIVGFAFARYFARDWVSARLPERVRRYDQAFARRGLIAVLVLRLFVAFGPIWHWMLGISQVRPIPYFIGTVIGAFPQVALLVLVTHHVDEWLRTVQSPRWIALGVVAAVVAIAAVVLWRRRARRKSS